MCSKLPGIGTHVKLEQQELARTAGANRGEEGRGPQRSFRGPGRNTSMAADMSQFTDTAGLLADLAWGPFTCEAGSKPQTDHQMMQLQTTKLSWSVVAASPTFQ